MGDHCCFCYVAVYRGSSIPNSLARDLRQFCSQEDSFSISHQRESKNSFFLLITVTSRRSECSLRSYLTLSWVGRKESTALESQTGLSAAGRECTNKHASASATSGGTMCENKHPGSVRFGSGNRGEGLEDGERRDWFQLCLSHRTVQALGPGQIVDW